jgi:glucose/arabinose dehydrogenase
MKTILTAAAVLACMPLQAQTTPPVTVDLVPWATGLQYVTEIAHCGDGRLFAATQGGTIWVISDSMTVLPQPFLNIWYKLWFSGEQGLIGLAFDPDYAENGHFYVNYTQPDSLGHNTIISRFTVTSDPNVADPNSEVVLMSIPQTGYEHKGGDLEFDEAGHLYISIGDGGPQGDPNQHAQNLNSRMGKLLRIDVQDDGSWTVPPDNPFVGAESDTLPEIWAYGLRNPYRIGLDTVADRLWIGDVGGSSYDEVDAVPLDAGGLNFGWRCYEGDAPFLPGDCPSDTGITWPVTTQANILNGGSFCALIGGKVYHGSQYPRLYGRYLYTDYCSGNIRSVRPADGGGWLDENLLPTSAPGSSCIAENHLGELFLANQVTQTVYKITDHCPMPAPVLTETGDGLQCSSASSYAWYHNGVLLVDSTAAQLINPPDGLYWVAADMGGGCLFTTDTIQVLHTGLAMPGPVAVHVRPNPARDQFTVTFQQPPAGPCQLELLDPLGRHIAHWTAMGQRSVALQLTGIPAGRYVLRITAGADRSSTVVDLLGR